MAGIKEKDLCIAFYTRYKMLKAYNQFSKRLLVFHVANEQNTSRGYTMMLRSMGLTAGVADYCVLVEGGRVAFIEFKRSEKEKKLKPKQQWFKEQCDALGIPYSIQWDVDKALNFLNDFANGKISSSTYQTSC